MRVRWVLCQAAQTANRHPDFAAGYQAITGRRGSKIAATAIARKPLARACHLLTGAASGGAPSQRGGSPAPGELALPHEPALAALDEPTGQPGPPDDTVMSPRPARPAAGRVQVRPPRQPTARPGNQPATPARPARTGKAVPRSRSPAAACRPQAPSSPPAPAGAALRALRLDPARAAAHTGSSEETPQPHSRPTQRPTPQATGAIQHGLLTTEAPTGAATRPSTTPSDETRLHGMQKVRARIPVVDNLVRRSEPGSI